MNIITQGRKMAEISTCGYLKKDNFKAGLDEIPFKNTIIFHKAYRNKKQMKATGSINIF
jgi:hypothetical protein